MLHRPSTTEPNTLAEARRPAVGVLVFIGIAAAACMAVPAYLLLWRAYEWQLKQPETVQGGIELIAVFTFLAIISRVRVPNFYGIAVAAVSMLYLQLHSVLLSAAAAWLFLECLIQTGSAITRTESTQDFNAYLKKFIAGAAGWTVGALLISALGMGSIPALRIYTIIIAAVSAAIAPVAPLGLAFFRRLDSLRTRDRVLVLLLVLLILTQFGKANYGNDYDSMWYGLRPERVLVGPHSLFDNLKLIHFVYYYPKQFELLTLPLAGLNHGAFIIPFNVVLLGLALGILYRIARELKLERTEALLTTALAGTVPAFSNMASTAKTDTLLFVYAFTVGLFLWKWCREGNGGDLCYGLAAIFGMAATKISAYAYAPLLVAGFVPVGCWMHWKNGGRLFDALRQRKNDPSGFAIVVPLVALAAWIGLMLRTLLLTGSPTMPAFVDKWQILGLFPKYPWITSGFSFTAVPVENAKEFFLYWSRLLFNPKVYSHYLMAWPGNAAFFFLGIILVLACLRSIRFGVQGGFLLACFPVMAGGIITACLVRTPNQGFTDGNYYAVPVILAILAAAGVLAGGHKRIRGLVNACTIGFILLQLPIMFVSHWSWHPGTQPFRFALNETLFNRRAEIESRIRDAGAWELEEYLRAHPGKGLCVGFTKGQESALHMLSCVHEDFEQTAPLFWRLFSTQSGIRQYLAWARPDILIMPKSPDYSPSGPGTPIRSVFEELVRSEEVIRVESRNFIALDLSNHTY